MDTGQVAVEAAKKFAGTHLGYVVESGFDEGCCKAFAAEWNNLTGMNVEVIPQPTFGVREKVITEGMAKSGAVDLVNAFPIWYPDFITGRYIVPLNQYVSKYQPDMSDFIFQDYFTASIWQPGVQWSLPIDGDTFMLYYRKDIFEHPDERANFKAQYGYDLAPPETWQQYTQIAKFLTRKAGDKLAGQTLTAPFGGQIEFRAKGGVFWWFFNRLGAYGGRYFNKTANNIEPAINSPAGFSPEGHDRVYPLRNTRGSCCSLRRDHRGYGGGKWGYEHILAYVRSTLPVCAGVNGRRQNWVRIDARCQTDGWERSSPRDNGGG